MKLTFVSGFLIGLALFNVVRSAWSDSDMTLKPIFFILLAIVLILVSE